MTLTQIRYFVKVAECLNFTEAANQLYISQQAISRQIANLEIELGFKLLARSTKAVKLTEGGKILFETWGVMLKQHDNAVRTAAELYEKQKRRLRIGIAEIIETANLVVAGLTKFIENYPDTEIEYGIYPPKQLGGLIRGEKVDLIITLQHELQQTNMELKVHPFKELELYIVLSDMHPLSLRNALLFHDLKGETFYILSNYNSDIAKIKTIAHCRSAGFEPANVQYFDTPINLELALYSGKGVSLTYQELFRNEKGKLKFYPTPITDNDTPQKMIAAWQPAQTKLVQPFIEILLDLSE